jgi:hydroxyacylglutathione hydrolase
MSIKQIYVDNTGRNFNYIIACDNTGDALVIDPLDSNACLQYAQDNQLTITQILNTHEHCDHTQGNAAVVAATQARILAHTHAIATIADVDRGLHAGDVVQVGNSIQLDVLDTPGHTAAHVCLFGLLPTPVLFCGDTLFNAGVGNCHHGGEPTLLYHTFAEQIFKLPDATEVYPGHDYMVNNLRFTLSLEPDNTVVSELLLRLEHQDPHQAFISTLAWEKQINLFFRLDELSVINALRQRSPALPEQPSSEDVFLYLRKCRDLW